jgi:hypothetical protein
VNYTIFGECPMRIKKHWRMNSKIDMKDCGVFTDSKEVLAESLSVGLAGMIKYSAVPFTIYCVDSGIEA